MSYEDQKSTIIQILKHERVSSTENLVSKLYFSRSTLRRVLIQMEDEGLVRRSHGRVELVDPSRHENPANRRFEVHQDEKLQVSKKALPLIRNGMVIFLDSSSTIYRLSGFLKEFEDLKIITNGLHVAMNLRNLRRSEIYICPGRIRPGSTSVIGEIAVDFIDSFHADLAIFSCKSIDPRGGYEGDSSQAMIKMLMARQSKETALLFDHHKIHEKGYYRSFTFPDINYLVCDCELPNALKVITEEHGCQIL
ncbi:MAG: DeoR/GlpR family DNA-binding transcription regulator [Eubacteriales bacterium]|nr:DeoR/GlpR family DNA-binding transcription regulator [Eubacteriales bacterium]